MNPRRGRTAIRVRHAVSDPSTRDGDIPECLINSGTKERNQYYLATNATNEFIDRCNAGLRRMKNRKYAKMSRDRVKGIEGPARKKRRREAGLPALCGALPELCGALPALCADLPALCGALPELCGTALLEAAPLAVSERCEVATWAVASEIDYFRRYCEDGPDEFRAPACSYLIDVCGPVEIALDSSWTPLSQKAVAEAVSMGSSVMWA